PPPAVTTTPCPTALHSSHWFPSDLGLPCSPSAALLAERCPARRALPCSPSAALLAERCPAVLVLGTARGVRASPSRHFTAAGASAFPCAACISLVTFCALRLPRGGARRACRVRTPRTGAERRLLTAGATLPIVETVPRARGPTQRKTLEMPTTAQRTF